MEVLSAVPHDPAAYTQGLLWHGGEIFESTGLYGRSSLRRTVPRTGEVLQSQQVDPNLFAEGLALAGNRLIQLTWKAGVALVYDADSFELVDEMAYNGEGWGLDYDGKRLVMSNGSARLMFRDPVDFSWLESIDVTLNGRPVRNLNELEIVGDRIYANVWGSDRIVRIDPESGRVDAEVDATGLLGLEEKRMVDVLNGIAHDPESDTFWITGKFWSRMFQVRFVPADQAKR